MSDSRIPRLWYLPNTSKKGKGIDWEKIQQTGWDNIKQTPHVLLVRAPLTFGHSQLVIPSPNRTIKTEKDFFRMASGIVEIAINTFEKAFKAQEIHESENFSSLAFITKTKGKYIKTLILRASASENVCEEYKIHLVPYFQSHEDDCVKRFRALHGSETEGKGGLLGWIGEKESEVDKLFELSPLKKYLDKFADEALKIGDLAESLRILL